MDTKEAIEALKKYPKNALTINGNLSLSSELKLAIEALEKQVPEEPKIMLIQDLGKLDACPNCGNLISAGANIFCHRCGKKLDWPSGKNI